MIPSCVIVDLQGRRHRVRRPAKKGTIVGKGVINNQMTNRLMAKMEKAGIPTHFVEGAERAGHAGEAGLPSSRLEVIVRNISAGSFRLALRRGGGHRVRSEPTIEFSYKNDALGMTPC